MKTSPTSRAFVAAQVVLFVAFVTVPRAWSAGWEPGAWGAVSGWGLVTLGAVLAVASGIALGRNLTPFPEPLERAVLVTAGPYRLARHPIYGGVLLAAVGWTLLSGSLVVALLTVLAGVFFDAKRRFEERSLRARFAAYDAYRNATRVFIPFVF